MAYQFPPDVEKLVKERMAAGGYTSEDEVLRDALEALGYFVHSQMEAEEEYRQTVAAVREGVADMEAGRTRPLRTIFEEAHGQSSDGTR
jgi:Arc/MetJ-type ribon-helix-helix transcriptional regulator